MYFLLPVNYRQESYRAKRQIACLLTSSIVDLSLFISKPEFYSASFLLSKIDLKVLEIYKKICFAARY